MVQFLQLPSPLPPGNPRDKVRPCVPEVGNFANSLVPGVGGGDNLGAQGVMGQKLRKQAVACLNVYVISYAYLLLKNN